jgi:hypothetical protein
MAFMHTPWSINEQKQIKEHQLLARPLTVTPELGRKSRADLNAVTAYAAL